MSIENMARKVKELKGKGHANREISQEMHLSQATIEWLLAKQATDNFDEQLPPDVKVGWRTIGVSGSRINSIAEIMADVILEEQEKHGFDLNMVAGLTNNGIPLAIIISDLLGIDFGMIRPSREGTEINYASNYAGLKDKHIVIVDDVVSTGTTAKEAINFIKQNNGIPVLTMVLINKKADDELESVPLRALIRARPVRN
ncbi:MAG: orotate phosphoribosyltransferase-like protein [Methanobacteriota archaeon]|jgi:orotate phosphoribosyltransferase|nr:MAG: orotate phosphoribosyltransferase-like protein [Euryarchaeota archaeon]